MRPLSHRLFQFRLRTLLIAFALLSPALTWMGYSLRWVRERNNGEFFTRVNHTSGVADRTAPAWLWLFGEDGANSVWVDANDSDGIAEAKRLFPEAEICPVFAHP